MKHLLRLTLLCPALLAALCAPLFCPQARAGAYIVADESNLDVRSHARNFNGYGGDLEPIRVCIDDSANPTLAAQAEPAVRNVISTFNRFRSLARNTYASGAAADVPAGQYDFESALLHEMLHAHGVAHPHHADESGLGGDAYFGTRSVDGPNNVWNQGAGADGIHGSADDVRGDDVNLHWYQRGVNDPGQLPGIVDDTTMARGLDALPAGQLFAANANRQVLAALGYTDAEAAAVQGARAGEAQRHLQHDDLATLRLARAGLDGIQGTGDDYRSTLVYVGRGSFPGEACQIAVRFDDTTAFATSSIGSFRITPNHWGILSARLRFNAAVNWYMTPGANTLTTIVSDLPDASTDTQPIRVRVNVAKAAGNPIATNPLGVIEVRDGPRSDPATAYCSITLAGTNGETGECELTPLSGGSKQLTAEYLGYGGFDASSDSEAHTVTGTVQFSAVGSSAAPVAVGAPLDVHWTLAPPFGALPMSFGGSVIVKDAPDCASPPADPAHQCSATLPDHTCRMTFQSAGTRNLVLCYAGDSAATAASASFTQNVIAGVATTTGIVTLTPAAPAPMAPVKVTVAVDETPAQGGRPAGIVEVRDGPAGDLNTAHCEITLQGLPGETGDCTLYPLQAGTRTVSATFAPQGRWSASAATTPMTVGLLRIARNMPTISRRGQGVTILIDLDVEPFGSEVYPSGGVTVSDGVDSCVISVPNNQCVWTGTTPGVRTLTATWSGDATHAPRTSAPVSQQVVDVPPDLELISTGLRAFPDANGASAGNASALSADGRYLVFLSEATNFVTGDTNGIADVFVRDQKTGLIRRVNTSSSGEQANGTSGDPAISGNGRYVSFSSLASNLVPGDTNGVRDVFVKDLATGSLVRVSDAYDGSQATVDNEFTGMSPSISADGRYVAFLTFARLLPRDTNIHSDVYVKDLLTGELDLVSTAADESLANFRNHMPSISPDGRYVVFGSQASNFVPEDTTITMDVYLKDRVTRSIRLVSSNAAGTAGGDDISVHPVVSAGGRYVAFMSYAHNMIPPDVNYTDIYVKDMQTGAIERANTDAAGNIESNDADLPAISPDGRYVAFQSKYYAPPPNSMTRIYVKDRQTGQLARGDRMSTGGYQTSGISLAPSISADGRYVSFHSASPGFTTTDVNGLADLFVYDQRYGTIQRSALPAGINADGASSEASLSRDGRYVVFASAATNLVNNDTGGWRDVFVQDRTTRVSTRMSRGSSFANADSDSPTISANGEWVAYRSAASNLVGGDSNGKPDVFLTQRSSFTTSRLSVSSAGAQTTTGTILGPVSLNADGTLAVFRATDTTLVAGDGNGVEDVFLRNRTASTTILISANAAGESGNGHSTQAIISDDGSRVAFTSLATNLLPGDDNGAADVYVKLLGDGSVLRASSSAAGVPGNGASGEPSLSSDGRYVAFVSAAGNLVAGDDNGRSDVFVKDLVTGTVVRANLGAAGQQGSGGDCSAPALSSDGQQVGFVCAQTGLVDGVAAGTPQVFVKQLQTGAIRLLSVNVAGEPGNAASSLGPRALADNGLLAFGTAADNLMPGDAQQLSDVFVNTVSTVPLIATATTITAHTPDPSLLGDPYVVSVSVTRTGGSGSIGGVVAVNDGSAFCSATLSGSGNSASGSCTLTADSAGTRSLRAAYAGDAAHAPSNAAAVAHVVATPSLPPSAPFIGTPARGNGQVAVSFLPPADSGGSAISGYTADCGGTTGTGSASPVVVSGLANGSTVRCRVRAGNGAGPGPWSALSAAVTPATVPTAPGGATATRGNAQVSVAFSPSAGDGGAAILGYVARCGGASRGGTASPIVVSGLSNGVAVSCTVVAVNAIGESAASAPSAPVTPASVPAAPAGVTATRGNAQVSVAFTAPNDGGTAITGYVARCGSASQTGAGSPLVVAGLGNGAPVTCTVSAINAIGEGPASTPSAPVTPATVPDAPTGVVATRGNAQVSVAFVAPTVDGGSGVTGYLARCAAASQSGTASPIVVSGLTNGAAVTCTVAAINAVGEGAASAPSAPVTPATVPDAPTAVVATRGNAQVSVAFTAPGVDGGSAVTGYTATCGSASRDDTSSPIVVTGLTNGTPVSCRVVARNAIGDGAASAPSNTVTPAAVPAAPQLTTAVGTANGTGAVLSFDTPDNGGSAITGYDASCTPGSHLVSGGGSPLTVTGLSAGSTYACTVSARNDIGTGSASNSLNVTPRIQADLSISNDNGVHFIRGGTRPDWLIEVNNLSGNGVTGARVQAPLPAHLTTPAWVCSAQGGATCPAASGSGALDVPVDLPAGARVSFLLSATVPATPEQPLQTTATVSLSGAFNDPQSANNTAVDGPDTVGIFRAGFE
jgi:Tol biopolymer transport system component